MDHPIPLLRQSPGIGRPYRLERLQGTSGQAQAAEAALPAQLLPGLTQAQAALREYVDSQFNILYAVTPDKVFLLNLRHHKQRGY